MAIDNRSSEISKKLDKKKCIVNNSWKLVTFILKIGDMNKPKFMKILEPCI